MIFKWFLLIKREKRTSAQSVGISLDSEEEEEQEENNKKEKIV